MPLDLTDDKSTLVQVMAWCHQAPSHYLSQCWPRSMSPNGITMPQWVNWLAHINTTNEDNVPHGKCNLMQHGSLSLLRIAPGPMQHTPINLHTIQWTHGCIMVRCLNRSLYAHKVYMHGQDPRGPCYWHGLTLIPALIKNYIHYKVWDEITYPFINLISSHTLLGMWLLIHKIR